MFADQPVERFAIDELHGDVIRAAGRADVIDVDDVGMIQSRGGLRLLLETSPALGTGGRIRTQDLDGYRPVEMRIEGPVDHAHSAFTELCFNPVMAEGLADHSPC